MGSPLGMQTRSHVYGPSLSKQDDWKEKAGTIAGTAHTQEYLLLHLAMFPIGLHTWCHVLGMPDTHQLQAQIIHCARKVLEFCPMRTCWLPPDTLPTENLKVAGYMVGSLHIRGQDRMQEWCGKQSWHNFRTSQATPAIALPPSLLTGSMLSTRQIRLIHHGDDRLCVWNQDMKMLQQRRFIVTHITGWRAYLGSTSTTMHTGHTGHG